MQRLEGDAWPDPAYTRALRRWSHEVVPPAHRFLIHSPRCDTPQGDPSCSACRVIAEWQQQVSARTHEGSE